MKHTLESLYPVFGLASITVGLIISMYGCKMSRGIVNEGNRVQSGHVTTHASPTPHK